MESARWRPLVGNFVVPVTVDPIMGQWPFPLQILALSGATLPSTGRKNNFPTRPRRWEEYLATCHIQEYIDMVVGDSNGFNSCHPEEAATAIQMFGDVATAMEAYRREEARRLAQWRNE